MNDPGLATALERADRALERIERALQGQSRSSQSEERLRTKVREAIAELDELIRAAG